MSKISFGFKIISFVLSATQQFSSYQVTPWSALLREKSWANVEVHQKQGKESIVIYRYCCQLNYYFVLQWTSLLSQSKLTAVEY